MIGQTLQDLSALLEMHRFRYTSERELQDGIEGLLTGNAFAFEREVQLSSLDRVDFLVQPGIAVECKVARRANVGDVGRQINRYLQSNRVESLILVTDRSQIGLTVRVPKNPSNKQIIVISLQSGLA